MASISNVNISSRDKKVEVKVIMNYDEFLGLKGKVTNIRMFSEDIDGGVTRIRSAGKSGESKYLLLPKELKKTIATDTKIAYQIQNFPNKVVMFYVLDK